MPRISNLGIMVAFLLSSCGDSNQKSPEPLAVGRLNFNEVMEFVKGVETSYQIEASQPGAEAPKVIATDFPTGAVFDEAKLLLTWKPSCDLNQKDGYFYRGYTVQYGNLTLVGQDERTTVRKKAVFLIHEKRQGVNPCG